MAGTYTCASKYQGTTYTQTYELDVYDQLVFFNTQKEQYLVSGTDSMINCSAQGASTPYVKWYRVDDSLEEIYYDTGKYEMMSEGLVVKNVTHEDAGIYRCSASVPITGEEAEVNINVKVMTIPVISSFTASPESTVIVGESLFIECSAEGLPDPEFIFEKISNTSTDRNATWVQDKGTIRFNSIQVEDAGIYECCAKNYVGNTTMEIEIKVLVPPQIIGFENVTVLEGNELQIHCLTIGNPPPNVTITYEGKTLDQEKDSIYEDNFIDNFAIIRVNRSNEGYYICNASNEVDYHTEIMYVTVNHVPYFEKSQEIVWGWNGEGVVLNCTNDANPPATVIWKYTKSPNTTTDEAKMNLNLSDSPVIYSFPISDEYAPFGEYKCLAQNNIGQAAKDIQLKKGYIPSKIVNASVIAPTATTASFSIEPPTDFEGPDILGFQAEYDIAENYNITHIHRNRTWALGIAYKLEKLKPNSTYWVKIAAINKVGTGPWGEYLEFRTLEKAAPEPPIWQVESPQIPPDNVLKWEEPEDNGEPIDYYALRYCPVHIELDEVDESLCKEHRIVSTEQELVDLKLNTTYYFELIAHNAKGNSTAVNLTLVVPAMDSSESAPLLSGGTIIGISVVAVLVCLLLLDLLLLFWRKQGIIASCCYKSKKKPNPLNSRDKKGLLKDNGESTDDTLRRPNNGHKEFEYNKTTGIITGKHSSV
ncbi:fasciclin-2-like isoform X2 [Anticarsia gemmatalis]